MAGDAKAGQSPAGGAGAQSALVGVWEKQTGDQCAETYPDRLEFTGKEIEPGKSWIYNGSNPPGSANPLHPSWDGGTYSFKDGHHIVMSTAYDAEIPYEFSISQGVLTFRDKAGCEFKYRRAR